MTFWKKQRFSRFVALIILNFPAILYYFVNNFDEGRILRGFEIIEYFLLFFVTALLVFYACNYIDKSNLVIQNLTETAMTDSLTNLPNMRFFTQQFGWIFTKSQKRKKSLSLFIIDIDHFKEINDFHGHQAGNTVLAQFSSILKNRTFPPRTMFARIGGEEFAVLLQNVGTEQAALIADFFREEVERAKFPYNPASGKVTVSIGVASASSNFSTTESLFEVMTKRSIKQNKTAATKLLFIRGNRMKRFILILILLIFIGAGFFIFLRPEPKKTVSAPKETTPTSTSVQTYVKENYTAKNGLIVDYKNAQEPHYLAESIGLYMEYLVEVNDSKTFQEQVSHLEKNFITEDNFIKWEATDATTTNAIVDDFRITEALYQASEKFSFPSYKKMADKILANTKKYSAEQGVPVDFYDFVHKKKQIRSI